MINDVSYSVHKRGGRDGQTERQTENSRDQSAFLGEALKETKSATMNIFRFFYFRFKSFAKVELSYVCTINLFTIAENCTEK